MVRKNTAVDSPFRIAVVTKLKTKDPLPPPKVTHTKLLLKFLPKAT